LFVGKVRSGWQCGKLLSRIQNATEELAETIQGIPLDEQSRACEKGSDFTHFM
jgi:hypothetical protein